jgi:hypothetical protein
MQYNRNSESYIRDCFWIIISVIRVTLRQNCKISSGMCFWLTSPVRYFAIRSFKFHCCELMHEGRSCWAKFSSSCPSRSRLFMSACLWSWPSYQSQWTAAERQWFSHKTTAVCVTCHRLTTRHYLCCSGISAMAYSPRTPMPQIAVLSALIHGRRNIWFLFPNYDLCSRLAITFG